MGSKVTPRTKADALGPPEPAAKPTPPEPPNPPDPPNDEPETVGYFVGVAGSRALYPGDRGDDVRTVQDRLGVKITGVYDSATESKVTALVRRAHAFARKIPAEHRTEIQELAMRQDGTRVGRLVFALLDIPQRIAD